MQNEALELQYKTCYARILDAKRRFLEAATRYYELSQMGGRKIGDHEVSRAGAQGRGGCHRPGLAAKPGHAAAQWQQAEQARASVAAPPSTPYPSPGVLRRTCSRRLPTHQCTALTAQ